MEKCSISAERSLVSLNMTCSPFLVDNYSKSQWIVTKLGMYINIVKIWFGIANWQFVSNFDGVICPRHTHIFVSGR